MKRKHKIGILISCIIVVIAFWFLFSLVSFLRPVSAVPAQKPSIQSSLEILDDIENPDSVSDCTLNVPYLSQENVLPTGCEIVSTAMVLQYWGIHISPQELAEILPCEFLYEDTEGLHGPDPNEYFVGSPFDPNSYGCYAPVIANLVSVAAPSLSSYVLYDCLLEELYENYVSQGIPVLLWCTINMLESYDSTIWILPDGSAFTWKSNEHCLVLTGRENGNYICMDPYDSNGQVSISSTLLEQRYEEMGSQAVAIGPES